MKNLIKISILLLVTFIVLDLHGQDNTCDEFNLRGTITKTTEKPPNGGTFPPPPNPEPPTLPPNEVKDRIVFWIHGFGGTNTSWQKASAISTDRIHHSSSTPVNPIYINDLIGFPARKIISDSPGYSSGLELPDYGKNMDDQIWNKSVAEDQEYSESKWNFCIAHSFGGLVARRAEVHGRANDGFRAGGIVGFGVPHNGAELANNLLELDNSTTINFPFETSQLKATDQLENFLNEASNELLAGWKSEKFETNFWLDLFSDGLTGAIDDFLNLVIGFAPNLVGPLFNQTALNLQVGNEQIEFLQNNPNFTHNVGFYGVEDSDLTLWRLFYWGVNDPNNPAESLRSYEGEGYFEAGDDRIAIQNFRENVAKFQFKVRGWNILHEIYKSEMQRVLLTVPFNPVAYLTLKNEAREAKSTRDAWQKGVNWWINSSEYWDLLTGALSFEKKVETVCFCHGFFGPPFQVDCDEVDTPGYTNCYQEHIEHPVERIYKPNDGAVLAESAVQFPGSKKNVMMEDSNHFQMRNDENTKEALLTLFDGDGVAYMFFKTAKKTF